MREDRGPGARLVERSDVPLVWWATAFYRVCWVALAALIIYGAARRA